MLTIVPPSMIPAAVSAALRCHPGRSFHPIACLFMGFGLFLSLPAYAQMAPVTASPIVSSPVSGVVFQDAPKILPIDSRFSQAIQTIAFDVGLTCDQVESYGWTIGTNEQDRVNNIFTQTAQELARLGYNVTPQSPGSAAADITVFTATRPDKNVLFTWSAGNSGLLLLMCDARSFNNGEVVKRGFGPGAMSAMSAAKMNADEAIAKHDPKELIGEWPGTYSCLGQGPTGGTLTINKVARDKEGYAVSGTFGFYPLKGKNPNVPRGLYRVHGRYDAVNQRAILEPGAWLQHPGDYYNAVMITEFNLDEKRTSGVFQGTTGCTSFEASYKDGSADRAASRALPDEVIEKPATKKKAKKKAAPKPALVETLPVESTAPVMQIEAPAATTPPVETPAPAAPSTTPGATGSAIPADSNGGAVVVAPTVEAAPAPAAAPAPTPATETTVQPTDIGIPTTTGPGLHNNTAGTPEALKPAAPDAAAVPAPAVR